MFPLSSIKQSIRDNTLYRAIGLAFHEVVLHTHSMKRLLITGFEPFGDQPINPAQMLVEELAKNDPSLTPLILPVQFELAYQDLKAFIKEQKAFDIILMLGQAGGRSQICLERVAHNWMENKTADRRNPQISARNIFENSPDALMTLLPVEKIRDHVNTTIAGSLVSVSLSAGAYVCNDLYYRSLTENSPSNIPTLFIHVPYLPEQVLTAPTTPSMDFEKQLEVLRQIIHFYLLGILADSRLKEPHRRLQGRVMAKNRRWVIKAGSKMVCDGGPLLMRAWMLQVAQLKKKYGIEVIWVTSGAIAWAVARTNFKSKKELFRKTGVECHRAAFGDGPICLGFAICRFIGLTGSSDRWRYERCSSWSEFEKHLE